MFTPKVPYPMTKTLTAAAVAKLRPGRQRLEVRDAGCAGLYLIIQKSGAKSFAMRFRRPNGEATKLTLGRVDLSGEETPDHPRVGDPLTLAAARSLAAHVHRERARGRDVVSDYNAEKLQRRAAIEEKANTFTTAALGFIDEHARPATRHWRETARNLGLSYPRDGGEPTEIKGGLASRWRDKPIGEITGHDIYAVVDESRKRGIPGLGRRNTKVSNARGRSMSRTLSKFFGWLVEHRKTTINPCAGVYCPPAPPSRDRVLTDAEIRLLWSACERVTEPFGMLVKMLLLTGARREEVARMTRSELSEDRETWNIPATRTKNKRSHTVPLAPVARTVLQSVKQIAGKPGYVFTTTGRTPISGFSKIKARIDAAMLEAAQKTDPDASVTPWRLHDLRRTCATLMAERCKIEPHIIEACLNHVSGAKASIAGTYNRAVYLEERKIALERWADYVEALTSGRKAKVLALRGAS
jgi:integrase